MRACVRVCPCVRLCACVCLRVLVGFQGLWPTPSALAALLDTLCGAGVCFKAGPVDSGVPEVSSLLFSLEKHPWCSQKLCDGDVTAHWMQKQL